MKETLGIIIAYTYVGLLYLVGIYYYLKEKKHKQKSSINLDDNIPSNM